jgi:hypothetical protein
VVICGIPVGMFLSPLISNEFSLFIKSFEFPAIEARSKPYNALMATISQDELINEDYSIDHVSVSMTHPGQYTGLVAVHTNKVYGTNLPFEDVQKQFAQFFSTRPDWHLDYVEYQQVTKYASSWAKYQTVYTIHLTYMEPGRSCHIG